MDSNIKDLWEGFAEAVLFTSYDENDEPLDSEYSIYDFDEESESRTKKLLENYYSKYKEEIEASELPLNTIGNDIWYARSGQGAGFFDHSLDSDIEEKLTKGATDMGEYASAFEQDGKVYIEDGRKMSFGGGVAVGGIVGAYLGYKVGRMRPQKAGFETEKKIGRRIKKEGKKIAGDMTISKKKPQTMEEGGMVGTPLGYKRADQLKHVSVSIGNEYDDEIYEVDFEEIDSGYPNDIKQQINEDYLIAWENYPDDYDIKGYEVVMLDGTFFDLDELGYYEKYDSYSKGGNIKPKYKEGDVVIVDYGNNTKGEITIKDTFNPNWSDGFVYTSYENGDSMIFTEDMISERDGFKEVWSRFKDRTRKDFGGDKYAEGGEIPSKIDEGKIVKITSDGLFGALGQLVEIEGETALIDFNDFDNKKYPSLKGVNARRFPINDLEISNNDEYKDYHEMVEEINRKQYAEGGGINPNDTWEVEGKIVFVYDERDKNDDDYYDYYKDDYVRRYPMSKFKTENDVIKEHIRIFKENFPDRYVIEDETRDKLYISKFNLRSQTDYEDRIRTREAMAYADNERDWGHYVSEAERSGNYAEGGEVDYANPIYQYDIRKAKENSKVKNEPFVVVYNPSNDTTEYMSESFWNRTKKTQPKGTRIVFSTNPKFAEGGNISYDLSDVI